MTYTRTHSGQRISAGSQVTFSAIQPGPDLMTMLTSSQTDRIIQMAWEDRTTFEAIRHQFGLEPGQVIKLMRKNLKPSSFRLWRARTTGRNTKHLSKRSFVVGRFRCPSQRG